PHAPQACTCNRRPSWAVTNKLMPLAKGPSSARAVVVCSIAPPLTRECRSLLRLLSYIERGTLRPSAERSDLSMQAIEKGKALRRWGGSAGGGAVYRAVRARAPRQFDALHLLGLIRYQQGRPGEAHELLSQAIKLRPGSTQALSIFMVALLAL